jgi:hypothetical protein
VTVTAGVSGAKELAALARRLKDAGEVQLRRDLYNEINRAARPLARQIGSAKHLKPYMPDRYADVLAADLAVTVSKRVSRDPGISIRARSRSRRRKVRQLDDGIISHPVFGHRDRWVTQRAAMRAGFFTDPCKESGPQFRDAVLKAMAQTARRVMEK